MRKRLPWIGVGLFVCFVAGLLIYSLVSPNHKATCEAHLRQIALALQNYSDQHGSFPPAYTLSPDGKPWHSWRVLILPQLGEEKLYKFIIEFATKGQRKDRIVLANVTPKGSLAETRP